MASMTVKVSVTDIEPMKELINSCATFAYTDNVSIDDFKAQTRYLLDQMGINKKTYAIGNTPPDSKLGLYLEGEAGEELVAKDEKKLFAKKDQAAEYLEELGDIMGNPNSTYNDLRDILYKLSKSLKALGGEAIEP